MGFFRKVSESNDEHSDIDGYARCIRVMKGYDTATTAVVTDSEDDLFFLEGEASVTFFYFTLLTRVLNNCCINYGQNAIKYDFVFFHIGESQQRQSLLQFDFQSRLDHFNIPEKDTFHFLLQHFTYLLFIMLNLSNL